MLHIDGGYIKNGNYFFYEKDHLGNNIAVIDTNGTLIQQTFYHPYGKPIDDLSFDLDVNNSQPYKYGGKEEETMLGLAMFDFHARQYYGNSPHLPPVFGQIDPLAEKYYSVNPYMYCLGNPLIYVDKDGKRPLPLDEPYNYWNVKVDSWFGPRNTNLSGASTNHKGLDFNYSGGGNTDYGTPILATHNGIATIDNNSAGGEGRSVYITSSDGSLRTAYFHLSEINVENGQYVSESDNIAKMGGSANGKDLGRTSHLHYEIQEMQDGKWTSINPTGGLANDKSNILDPQDLITPTINVTLPTVIVNGQRPNINSTSSQKVNNEIVPGSNGYGVMKKGSNSTWEHETASSAE
jgi:RHS repeat-associated protein